MNIPKRLAATAAAAAMSAVCCSGAAAAENWRDAFTTRIMKLMAQRPEYSEIVMTDLDFNGIPEAFLIKSGYNGGIGEGITMRGNVVSSIAVPSNVTGECLKDLTMYRENGDIRVMGREVGRYSSVIECYYIQFDGANLVCTPTKKETFSHLGAVAYRDVYGSDFMSDSYPSREKISAFINAYTQSGAVSAQPTSAAVSINGTRVELAGYNINYNNYFKIRDIAMVLRSTGSRFNVEWDSQLGAINIVPGTKYAIVGGELDTDNAAEGLIIERSSAPVYLNGVLTETEAYNINGSNYFKIRDLAEAARFEVDWDSETNTIVITTN